MSLILAVVLVVPFSGVASARQGNDDNTVAVSTETENESEDTSSSEAEDANDDKMSAKDRVEKLRTEAKTEIESKRKNRETLSADKRMKVCENRKKAIENKLNAFNNAADKHLTKLDSIYVKIVAFQEEKQVVVSNIDALKAEADAQKLAATEAVTALKTVAADVDCSDPETAVTLGAVRDAAKATREALHDYRMALKNIVVAIAQAQSDDAETAEDATPEEDTAATKPATEGAN